MGASVIAETSAWLEALVEDQEQSWCPKCRRKPPCFYIEPETLFQPDRRVCSTCKSPLTAKEE